MDFFFLLFAFVLGIFAYAIAIRFVPGMQPGEEKLNELFASLVAHFQNNTAALQANTVATQQASISAAVAPVPSTAEIAAATAALRLQNAAGSMQPMGQPQPSVLTDVAAPSGDETPVQWAKRTGAVPDADLIAFDAFAHTAPATMTYADILIAYKAKAA